jgi:cell division protein FtsB
MSTFLGQARVRTLRPSGPLPRPRLTIVPKVAARAPRIPFALLVVTVLAAGLVGLLLLNTSLQRGAYAVTDLQKTSDALTLQQQNLETQVAALQSPQRISERAVRLGMVANDSPAFLSLKTGRVIGVPMAGKRTHRPVIGVAGAASPRHVAKLVTLFAGEASSQTTGVVKVPKKKHHTGTRGNG